MSRPKQVVAFYHHAPCLDGSAAAWAMNEAFKNRTDVSLTFVPLDHGDPEAQRAFVLSKIPSGADVYFLDISPKAPTLRALIKGDASAFASLTIIDHHKTEIEPLLACAAELGLSETDPRVHFILDPKSPAAALMAWQHFMPQREAPKILNWVGRLESSVKLYEPKDFAIAAFIDSYDISTAEKAFASLDALTQVKRETMAEEGDKILTDQMVRISNAIDQTLRYAYLRTGPDTKHWAPLVNLVVRKSGRVVDKFLIARARDKLACKGGNPCAFRIAGAWFEDDRKTIQLSLRSDGNPDVGAIARYLGQTIGISGGGHAPAACVQIKNADRFAETVPLYTRAEMTEIQQHGYLMPDAVGLFRGKKRTQPPAPVPLVTDAQPPCPMLPVWPICATASAASCSL